MFRVPSDPDRPTFDQTEKVGFGRWLTSNKATRLEWQRRRNAAAKAAEAGQNEQVQGWVDRKNAERDARRTG